MRTEARKKEGETFIDNNDHIKLELHYRMISNSSASISVPFNVILCYFDHHFISFCEH